MCTYNGAGFLEEQLNSIANQTLLPDEIIICDDASSDNSVAIAEAFAERIGIPIQIHKNSRNLGYVKNFEKAIGLCSQELIFLCDQDDHWDSSKIETIVSVFDQYPPVGLVLHNFCRIDETNQLYPGPIDSYGINKLYANQLPSEIKANSIRVFMEPYPHAWCGCMMAYRQVFNRIVLPIFPGKGHDDWILKILAPITETHFIDQPLVRYRMHQKNTNRRDLEKHTFKYLVSRFIKKIGLVWKGHTKRHFYKAIKVRLEKSGAIIIYPELMKLYNKYWHK